VLRAGGDLTRLAAAPEGIVISDGTVEVAALESTEEPEE